MNSSPKRPPLIDQVEDLGGSVRAIEAGFIQEEIEEAAYRFQREIETEKRIIVGVNALRSEDEAPTLIQTIDPELQEKREQEVKVFRQKRDETETNAALGHVLETSRTQNNLFPSRSNRPKSRRNPGRGLRCPPRRMGRI